MSDRVKDVLLEHVAKDIKKLQSLQSDMSTLVDMVSNSHSHAQSLCEHLDRLLMHGLRESEGGYWVFVRYFTRSEVIHTLNALKSVHMDIGRGRAWLYVALNEQVMESYVRMFIENQGVARDFYLQESFVRDVERLIILQTLVSGLDFITFDLAIDCDYLDFAPTEPSSRLGISRGLELTPDIEPSFLGTATQSLHQLKKKSAPVEQASQKSEPVEQASQKSEAVEQASQKSEAVEQASQKPEPEKQAKHKPVHAAQQSLPSELNSKEALPALDEAVQLPTPLPEPTSFLERLYGQKEESELVVRKQKKTKRKKKKKQKLSTEDEVDSSSAYSEVPTSSSQREDIITVYQESPSIAHQESCGGQSPSNKCQESPSNVRQESPSQESPSNKCQESPSNIGQDSPISRDRESPITEQEPPNRTPVGSSGFTVETHPNRELHTFTESSSHTLTSEGSLTLTGEGSHTNTSDKSENVLPMLVTGPVKSPSPEQIDGHHLSYSEDGELTQTNKDLLHDHVTEEMVLQSNTPGARSSPLVMSEVDKRAADVVIDENTRLVLSLDVVFEDSEELCRLVQVATPTGLGQQRNAYLLISDKAVYLVRKDGIEGIYSRELGIRYFQFEHIVIGLGWQSLELVYFGRPSESISQSMGGLMVGGATERCVLLTGREAVSRGLVESVCQCAAQCPGFLRSIPLNRDDEMRLEAIEKELIKLGSQTSMDIVRYSLINWEQVSGDPPPFVAKATRHKACVSGFLLVKTTSMIGMPTWKQAYFELKSGSLHQYTSEGDSTAKSVYIIRNCGGCTRVTGEGKPFTISILNRDGSSLVLAAPSENELARWVQALCEASIGVETPGSPPHRRTCLNCALLLTQNMLHILLEDWDNNSVQLVTSCRVTDVNDISVDHTLPLYCTVAYDHGSSQGVWLICFNSEFELSKFESALSRTWEEEFQISLSLNEVKDAVLREKAHRAVELMQSSKYRSDSITRGRSEFTYSAAF